MYWQLDLGVAAIVVVWALTTPARPISDGLLRFSVILDFLVACLHAIFSTAAPQWGVQCGLWPLLAVASTPLILAFRWFTLIQPDDDGFGDDDDIPPSDPDGDPPGGLTVNWDAFESASYDAWCAHDAARPAPVS
jgi:hypothetical protein